MSSHYKFSLTVSHFYFTEEKRREETNSETNSKTNNNKMMMTKRQPTFLALALVAVRVLLVLGAKSGTCSAWVLPVSSPIMCLSVIENCYSSSAFHSPAATALPLRNTREYEASNAKSSSKKDLDLDFLDLDGDEVKQMPPKSSSRNWKNLLRPGAFSR
jgi:hypothetical protein